MKFGETGSIFYLHKLFLLRIIKFFLYLQFMSHVIYYSNTFFNLAKQQLVSKFSNNIAFTRCFAWSFFLSHATLKSVVFGVTYDQNGSLPQ